MCVNAFFLCEWNEGLSRMQELFLDGLAAMAFKQKCCPVFDKSVTKCSGEKNMDEEGIEPPTSRMRSARSNFLSLRVIMEQQK